MELLEKVAAAGGQLLRVEVQGASDGAVLAALILTFDIGRVLVQADSATGLLLEQYLEPADARPVVNADEQDPWWRVLGSPLSRVLDIDSGGGSVGVALQFRQDGDNPRRIALLARGDGLVVQLQKPDA